jgi:RNA recognition motif-containing protein
MKGAPQATPCANLYISDLPGDIDEGTLLATFGAYGTVVQHKILPKPNAAVTTTHALIRYSTVDEAKWIFDNVNGNIPQGLSTPIKVTYNNSDGKGSGKGKLDPFGKGYGKMAAMLAGKGAGPYGWQAKPAFSIKSLIKGLWDAQALPGSDVISNDVNAIYVHGLPKDTEDCDLYKIFAPFGAIAPKGVRAMLHPDGSCMGFGFINYIEPGPVEVAITTLNGTQMPDGKTLTVKVKDSKSMGGMA